LPPRLDPRLFRDVVAASSGASWICPDRMPHALEGDCAPRAATALLKKDVGITVETAAALGCVAPLARAAREVFDAAVASGGGADDDSFSLKHDAGRAKQT
jgi:3-hydroxyisobutyrate dehydrogenase-like beta-hydroxyacid dehydrogenase